MAQKSMSVFSVYWNRMFRKEKIGFYRDCELAVAIPVKSLYWYRRRTQIIKVL